MPYKPRALELMPDWINELSDGDSCLKDILTEAWVASQTARMAVRERGNKVPRSCARELEAAEGILDAISEGRTPRGQLSKKAAQAVRKFDTAYQCAKFRETDSSPQFAQEPVRTHYVRLLAAREDSVLGRHARKR